MKKSLVFAALGLAVAMVVGGTTSAKADQCPTCNGYVSPNYGTYGTYYNGFPNTDSYDRINRNPNYQYSPTNRYDYQSYYRPRYDSGYLYRGYRSNNIGNSSPYYQNDYYGNAGYGSQFNFYNPGLIGN